MRICVAPYNVLGYPQGGGYAWVYNNWSLGLQANGHEVFWLEESFRQSDTPAAEVARRIQDLRASLDRIGLRASIALLLSAADRQRLQPVAEELARATVPFETVADESDLLLNFNYSLDAATVARFRRTALVDVDPGLLQMWISSAVVTPAAHDLYFTTGETVGTPAARFPDGGLRWHYTPPPVFLPAWPPTPADPTAPYTTVSSWWGEEWMEDGDEVYCNDKRASFLDYLDLPSRTAVPLELALCLGGDEDEERQLLEQKGWRIRHAWEVSETPEQYQAYIRQSRGEFSCAKPSCMRLSNAWISDRTLCYLASGKPAVVQHTGPSRFLPDAEGLVRFRDLDEAARALNAVESDYARHCQQARKLVEEYFDAQKVTQEVLRRALN